MTNLQDNHKIIRLFKDLKIKGKKDPVTAIREYCDDQVDEIISTFSSIQSLDNLLDIVASYLGVKFEELNEDADIQRISNKYLSKKELIFANLKNEFTDETDALLIECINSSEGESKFIAVIDCRGIKKYKSYFSKWHEIAHVLAMPPQRSFPILYRTTVQKKEPKESLMDMIASDFAFYSPLFLPELNAKLKTYKKLSFKLIDELRAEVCPNASRHATALAAVSKSRLPAIFLIAQLGLKKEEERMIESSQLTFIKHEPISEKLRVKQIHVNLAAKNQKLYIHKNMEIPSVSVITNIFQTGHTGDSSSSIENLNWWKHSKGKLQDFEIEVEALKSGNRVLSIIQPL